MPLGGDAKHGGVCQFQGGPSAAKWQRLVWLLSSHVVKRMNGANLLLEGALHGGCCGRLCTIVLE